MEKKLNYRIIEARKRIGITQMELAKRLDIAYQTLNKYEKGHRIPDAELLSRMTNEFNCNPGWLLTGEGDIDRGTSVMPKEGEKKVSITQDIKLSDLITKLEYIYKEGSLDEKIKVRGTIEEVNDAIKSRK